MEAALIILGFICILTGFFGSFLPVLPGPPLSYGGILLMHFSAPENRYSIALLVILAALAVIVTVLDYLIPAWGTKKFGGSKYGVWGSNVGVFLGLFFGPVGIILLPFFGAFVGELLFGRKINEALRSAFGSFAGFLLGTGLKLILCGVMLFYFIAKLIGIIGNI